MLVKLKFRCCLLQGISKYEVVFAFLSINLTVSQTTQNMQFYSVLLQQCFHLRERVSMLSITHSGGENSKRF